MTRARAHTEFDGLTLLFQHSGQDMEPQLWMPIEHADEIITRNVPGLGGLEIHLPRAERRRGEASHRLGPSGLPDLRFSEPPRHVP